MTVTIDKKQCPTFKTFYEIVYKELDGKRIPDWEAYENLNYHADLFNEFLWYVNDVNIDFVLLNTDVEKIKEEKTKKEIWTPKEYQQVIQKKDSYYGQLGKHIDRIETDPLRMLAGY